MNPYNFSVLLFAFSTFILSLILLLRHRDEVSVKYFIFCLFVTLWGSFYACMISDNASYHGALIASRLCMTSAAFVGPAWLIFCMAYTKSRANLSFLKLLLIPYGLVILSTSGSPWFVPSVKSILGFKYYTETSYVFTLVASVFCITIIVGFVTLIKAILKASGSEKKQLIFFALATFIGFSGGGLTFLPAYGIPFPQYGLFLMPLYAFITSYLVARTNLFNLEQLVNTAQNSKLTSLGILAASIHHELKNPLYVIKCMSEVGVKHAGENKKASEGFLKIKNQADRAFQMTARLTRFAKKRADENQILEEIKLDSFMEDLIPLFNAELVNHAITFEAKLDPGIPVIKTDRGYLEEILFNLIINASQALKNAAMENRKIVLESALEKCKPVLRVIDNGPGIPPEKLTQIFEPFYTTKSEGVGLGLYITRQLCEKIGAKITAQSIPRQATTFTLTF